MWHEPQLFLIALHAGTRLPLPAWAGGRPQWQSRSARHSPAGQPPPTLIASGRD